MDEFIIYFKDDKSEYFLTKFIFTIANIMFLDSSNTLSFHKFMPFYNKYILINLKKN